MNREQTLIYNLEVACQSLMQQYSQLMQVHHGPVFNEYSDPYIIQAKEAMEAVKVLL